MASDEQERREFADMLVLARRMLRSDACETPLAPAVPGSDEEVLEQAVALCLRAYARGSSCVALSELEQEKAAAEKALNRGIVDGAQADVARSFDTPRLRAVLCAHPEICYCGALPSADEVRMDVPLNLDGDLLYLTRCARMEKRIAAWVDVHLGQLGGVDSAALARAIRDLRVIQDAHGNPLGELSAQQVCAIEIAATHRFTVLTGGPGTGKTTVVVRILAALDALQSDAESPLDVRVCAPTGKASARLREAMRAGALTLRGATESERERLLSIANDATTLHSLLGATYSALETFVHNERNPLTGDVFIVDEVSMVSLSMLDAFLRTVPARARVILVGDPDQLASVDAGTVLSDLVRGLRQRDAEELVELNEGHRSKGGVGSLVGDIQQLSQAEDDDCDERAQKVAERIADGSYEGVRFLDELRPDGETYRELLAHYAHIEQLVQAGMVDEALKELGAATMLCAHRNGSLGSLRYNERIAQDLAAELNSPVSPNPIDALGERLGCPIMVMSNDRRLNVHNGDVGVLAKRKTIFEVAFDDPDARGSGSAQDGVRAIARAEIADAELAYATTIHKSQGSEYESVIVQLAEDETSPLNVRELLYTGVSRAKRQVTIVGSREALAYALATPVRRASGLARRLG